MGHSRVTHNFVLHGSSSGDVDFADFKIIGLYIYIYKYIAILCFSVLL